VGEEKERTRKGRRVYRELGIALLVRLLSVSFGSDKVNVN
jgi:hypothetical protein